jgi:hypothetical protein
MTDAPKYQADGRYQLPLYVTDKQLIQRMGVGIRSGQTALQEMRQHAAFSPRAIGGKRYWPSVVDFLDFWNARRVEAISNPKLQPGVDAPRYRGGIWENLQAAKKQLPPDLAAALDRDSDVRARIASDEERLADGGHRRRGMENAVIQIAVRRLLKPGQDHAKVGPSKPAAPQLPVRIQKATDYHGRRGMIVRS